MASALRVRNSESSRECVRGSRFVSHVRLQVPRYVPASPSKKIVKQIWEVLNAMAREPVDVSGLKVGSIIDDVEYQIGEVIANDSRFLTVAFSSQQAKIKKPFFKRPLIHLWAHTVDQAKEDVRNAPRSVKLIELVRVAQRDADADIRTLLPSGDDTEPESPSAQTFPSRSEPMGQKWVLNRRNRSGH
jgi:hypothetical protein